MKKYLMVIVAVVVVIVVSFYFYGRSQDQSRPTAAAPPTGTAGPVGGAAAEGAGIAGEVLETLDAGGYTYVRVKSRGGEVWAAGPQTPVRVGDAVAMPAGMKMENFESETLARTFDEVYFVSEIRVGAAAPEPTVPGKMPMNHPPPQSVSADVDLTGIEVPEGGINIAALYANREEYAGERVLVRGRVVKFTPAVMGKNWIHLRDGTGEEGANDLTVTTGATVAVGDLVTALGTVVLDRDFGFGYEYPVLLEDANVTLE